MAKSENVGIDSTVVEQIVNRVLKEMEQKYVVTSTEQVKPELSDDFDQLGLNLINHSTDTVLGLLVQKFEQETNSKCILSRPHRKTAQGHNSLRTRRYNIVIFKHNKSNKYLVTYPKFTEEMPVLREHRERFDNIHKLTMYLRKLPISSWYISKLEKIEGGR